METKDSGINSLVPFMKILRLDSKIETKVKLVLLPGLFSLKNLSVWDLLLTTLEKHYLLH